MLSGVDAREFDEWIAYRRIEPDPDERLREILKLGFAAICRLLGNDVSPDRFDPWDDSEPDRPVGPAEAAAILHGQFSHPLVSG